MYTTPCGRLWNRAGRYWPVNRRFRFWRSVPGGCTSHQIHNVQVEKILLRELRRITAYAHEHEDDFVQLVTRQSEKELNRQLRDSNRELAQAEARIQKLDVIMQRLYEDNVDGKISDERFARMAKTYEDEQRQLESRKVELDAFIVHRYHRIDCGDHPHLRGEDRGHEAGEGSRHENEKADHRDPLEFHRSCRDPRYQRENGITRTMPDYAVILFRN